MTSKSRHDIRKQHGQAMVELTLILPLLFVIFFAVIQFGIVFKDYVTLTDATRAGPARQR